ncbi:5-formyltetrahydrofolate cyclo-ligase [Streptococcus parasanguinis]|jgi:5-formyltetrahydrofolate cyclo-ligase|uniref:5-formyltetrahydrofolate cyclo-ligase n=1 Tax=Streptococcus TaxID=1301 RepID=UPI00066D8CDD|nr:5-formyltetrahydrofolate cyclo-ligase [Streptococcus parasanguinis]MCP9068572.1 5-formyltetrahydrofolate cyclo-ligase [Streptococcus parasanguinis]
MKKILRNKTIAAMKELPQSVKAEADSQLTQRFIQLPAFQEAKTLATYLSMGHEFSTASLIQAALQLGKRVCVPRTYPQGRMEFVEYDPDILEKTRFGLLEPNERGQVVDKSEIDLIHVPGLVFQSKGYRIGYGGGYYDRYLADYTGKTVSTIYSIQQKEFQPDVFDQAVQEVLVYEVTL